MEPDPASLLILLLLLVFSAIFSGSETALVSLTPARIKAMNPRKHRSVRLIERLKERPQKMLTTILLGNNVVNIAATAYATVLADRIFETNAITIVTAIMTVMVLIFGEILPKAIANRYQARFARIVIYLLLFVEVVFYPIIWMLEKFISQLLRVFGQTNIQAVTEDELKALVTIGAEEGSLEQQEQEFIENVLDFDETEVSTIMTPRVKIDAVTMDHTIEETVALAVETRRSRLPIYQDSIDNVVSVVSVKDLLELHAKPENRTKKLSEIELSPVLKCPETRKINSLFNELRQKRLHIAFVYDEFGGLEGLVTMEDILEELVGEILDESDVDELADIEKINDQTLLVSGSVPLKDIIDELDFEIEDYEHNDHIAWVILDILNRYPKKGEVIKLTPHVECTVEKMSSVRKVIEKVRVEVISS